MAVKAVCYPFGKPPAHFDQQTDSSARSAGYEIAGAVGSRAIRSADVPLAVPRIIVSGTDVPTLATMIRGDWDLLSLLQEATPKAIARLISPADYRF